MHRTDVMPHMDPRLDEPSILAYNWRAFVWPGRRLRFDGKPVVVPPAAEDVSWVPTDGLPPGVSLGA